MATDEHRCCRGSERFDARGGRHLLARCARPFGGADRVCFVGQLSPSELGRSDRLAHGQMANFKFVSSFFRFFLLLLSLSFLSCWNRKDDRAQSQAVSSVSEEGPAIEFIRRAVPDEAHAWLSRSQGDRAPRIRWSTQIRDSICVHLWPSVAKIGRFESRSNLRASALQLLWFSCREQPILLRSLHKQG